jgi:hypothetical protein
MSLDIVNKIVHRTGIPDLLKTLSEKISSSELNSLLLEVFHRKVEQCTPADLLRLYQQNRFVKPADTPVLEMRETELSLLKIFQHNDYEPLELSPVSILGSCSVVAPANQKKILSALRGTEVLADATNAIALHICDLKKRKVWMPQQPNDKLRYGTIQRHVRTQAINGKGFTPHFKIGCLVTSGLDTGNFTFEKESLSEHINIMNNVFLNFYKVADISFRFLCRDGYPNAFRLASAVRNYVANQAPDAKITIEEAPQKHIGYYQGIQYKVDIKVNERWFEIGDGGFVNWTQQLLQNKKERYLITGFGFEFMYRVMKGQV